MQSSFRGIKFSDDDVVNQNACIFSGEYNPHNIHPWLFHDHGFVVCVVFASNLQDALDDAVAAGKFHRYMIDLTTACDRGNYLSRNEVSPSYDPNCPDFIDADGNRYWWREGMEPAFLGNASEPFDIESLSIEEMPIPKRSFCAQFEHMTEDK